MPIFISGFSGILSMNNNSSSTQDAPTYQVAIASAERLIYDADLAFGDSGF